MTVLLIAGAGAAGVLARYGIGQVTPSIWATLFVNVIGSLLLGVLVQAGRELSPELRDVLGVGLLGGFTTFSTFSVQAVLDTEAGEPGRAMAYVLASVVLGIAAAGFGYWIGHVVRH